MPLLYYVFWEFDPNHPAARGSDLGCVCVGGRTEEETRGLRLSRVPPGPPMPPVPGPPAPRGLCAETTQRLCGSHAEVVWQPHRLCGSHTRAVAVPQQHIVAVKKSPQPVGYKPESARKH